MQSERNDTGARGRGRAELSKSKSQAVLTPVNGYLALSVPRAVALPRDAMQEPTARELPRGSTFMHPGFGP